MSKKRSREQASVDTELVEIFEDLSSSSEKIRLKAAQSLCAKVTPDNTGKILNRLIRGLCSGRKVARPGFAIALTEFLAQGAGDGSNEHSDVLAIVRSLEEQTEIGTKAGGQEGRDYYIGRIFGVGAIIKSKILFRHSDLAVWDILLELILKLAKEKSSLRKECGWVLSEATEVLNGVTNGKVYAQRIIDRLQESGLVKTPEGVAIWIRARQSFPELDMPKRFFHKENPLDRKETLSLARILKESSSEAESREDSTQIRGMWYPKPHFAWDVVFKASLDEQSTSVSFSELWSEAVDDGLFSQSSSDERKYWGFCLFQGWMLVVPLASLHCIFGKNMLRCLTNQRASNERNLHGIAGESLKAIQRRGSTEPGSIPTILRAILNTSNHAIFIKSAERLLSLASPGYFKEIIPIFGALIDDPPANEGTNINAFRQTLADLLVTAIRSKSPLDGAESSFALFREMACSILHMFALYAYVDGAVSSSNPLTETTRNMFRSRITSCLTTLVTKDPDPSFHSYKLLTIVSPKKSTQKLLFSQSADKQVLETVRQGWKTLEKLSAEKVSSFNQAFMALYAITILQVYNGEADAVAIMDELQEYHRALRGEKNSNHTEAADGILEIILSLMSKQSLLFRRLATQLFSAFSSIITEEGLGSMIRVLETREDIAGQDDLFDKDNEDDDVEMVDANDSNVQEVDEQETTSSEEGGSIPNGSIGAAETVRDEALEAKLAELLGTRRLDSSTVPEDEEESDEDMNDEQMEALTPHIEKTFRERGKAWSKKKERQDAKEAIVLLKCRVLELLEIYIKQQPLDSKALGIIKPLLLLMQSTTSKQARGGASNIIREAARRYKLSSETQSQDETVGRLARTLLPEIHELALRQGPNVYSISCSSASILFVKVMLGNGGGSIRDVLDQYSRTCERALKESGCKYRPSFHLDLHNWLQAARETIGKLER